MPDEFPPAERGGTRRSFRRAPGDERRRALIRATLDCIAENGLQAATVREVAVRAGVTNGLIRHYFETKDHMIQEAYRTTMAEMTAMATSAGQASGGTAASRLARFVAANLSEPVVDIKRLTLWASFISMVHVDRALAAIHREHYLAFRAELEPLVAAVLAEADRTADAHVRRSVAIKINAAIDGLWLEGSLAPDLFSNGELVATGTEAVEAILGVPLGERAGEI